MKNSVLDPEIEQKRRVTIGVASQQEQVVQSKGERGRRSLEKDLADILHSTDSEHKSQSNPSVDSLDEPFVKPGYQLLRRRAKLIDAKQDTPLLDTPSKQDTTSNDIAENPNSQCSAIEQDLVPVERDRQDQEIDIIEQQIVISSSRALYTGIQAPGDTGINLPLQAEPAAVRMTFSERLDSSSSTSDSILSSSTGTSASEQIPCMEDSKLVESPTHHAITHRVEPDFCVRILSPRTENSRDINIISLSKQSKFDRLTISDRALDAAIHPEMDPGGNGSSERCAMPTRVSTEAWQTSLSTVAPELSEWTPEPLKAVVDYPVLPLEAGSQGLPEGDVQGADSIGYGTAAAMHQKAEDTCLHKDRHGTFLDKPCEIVVREPGFIEFRPFRLEVGALLNISGISSDISHLESLYIDLRRMQTKQSRLTSRQEASQSRALVTHVAVERALRALEAELFPANSKYMLGRLSALQDLGSVDKDNIAVRLDTVTRTVICLRPEAE